MKREELANIVRAIVIGHAVGDAVGGPVQFELREALDAAPVTDMMSFGEFSFRKGAWSDDTSMSLCAMDALTRYGLDYDRVMENFRKWMFEGEFTPTGHAFDIGNACFEAVNRSRHGTPTDQCGCAGEFENGNGSLMRIYPFSLYLYFSDVPTESKLVSIHRASALTHAHPRSCIGCGVYSCVLWAMLEEPGKQGVREGLARAAMIYGNEPELRPYHRLFEEGFEALPREEISSSGYVVDTLEAALWCLLTTDNFRDCILKAVNLGLDTDSVGAVAGSLAGLLYGYNGIPSDWSNALIRRELFEDLGGAFTQALLSL